MNRRIKEKAKKDTNIATLTFRDIQMRVQNGLKICFDGKEKLIDEDALEGGNIVLFVEHQHGLFVVNRIYSAE